MLKDLKIPVKDIRIPTKGLSSTSGSVSSTSGSVSRSASSEIVSNDYDIASKLVDVLFYHINESLQRDRSRAKINMFTKGFIKTSLGRTAEGTKDYLNGMYSQDIKKLIDDMQNVINKRKI